MDCSITAAYLQLLHGDNFSSLLLSRALKKFCSLHALRTTSTDNLIRAQLTEEQICLIRSAGDNPNKHSEVANALEWQQQDKHHIILYESELYPALLREIHSPPPLLFVSGNPKLLNQIQFAIVGSRKASQYGLRNSYWIAHELAAAGLTISSGLASGIDASAHRGAISGGHATLAVVGTGVDVYYPWINRKLAEEIENTGAVVSEFPLGTKPFPGNFPRRNRLISGMSIGTLVVEASVKSGSLITARLAMEQNRDVFAFPGAICSQTSKGCHRLIKDGAKLVEEPDDILFELGWPSSNQNIQGELPTSQVEHSVLEEEVTGEHSKILDVIGSGGCSVESILAQTGMEFKELNTSLVQLELSGQLSLEGGRYRRVH